MEREIFTTEDGSSSIYVKDLNENYHSKFGAINESMHIYINSGLKVITADPVSILEIGFGTGLNAILSYVEGAKSRRSIDYTTIEKYPLIKNEWSTLNFFDKELKEYRKTFEKMHELEWECKQDLNSYFSIVKKQLDLKEFATDQHFDLVYFDAFAPDVQPDLWTREIFSRLYSYLNPGGILLTYSVKGTVKRTLRSCGFETELLPGPKGKREIMRAHR